MKNFKSTGLLYLLMLMGYAAHSQHCHHYGSAPQKLEIGFLSDTLNQHSDSFALQYYIVANDTLVIDSAKCILGDSIQVGSYGIADSSLLPQDSMVNSLSLSHSHHYYPYYIEEVRLVFYSGGHHFIATAYFYFTPWQTIEIYNIGDFPKDREMILPNALSTPQWIYIDPDTLPTVDTTLPYSYHTYPGLGYAIPVNDTIDTIGSSSNKTSKTYVGSVKGRIIYTYTNDLGDIVDIPIAKIKVAVMHGNDEIAVGETDDMGWFDIDYHKTSYNILKNVISLSIKVFSQDKDDAENTYRNKAEPGSKIVVYERNSLDLPSDNHGTYPWDFQVQFKKVFSAITGQWDHNYNNGDAVHFNLLEMTAYQRNYFHIYHWARRAYDFAKEEGMDFEKKIYIMKATKLTNWYGNTYTVGNELIQLEGEESVLSETVVQHEFGHVVHTTAIGVAPLFFDNSITVAHPQLHFYPFNNSHPTQTLAEGFADAFMVDTRYFTDDQEATRDDYRLEYHKRLDNTQIKSSTHPMTNERLFAAAIFDLWDDYETIVNLYGYTKIIEDLVIDKDYGLETANMSLSDILLPFSTYHSSGANPGAWAIGESPVVDVSRYFYELGRLADCDERGSIKSVIDVNFVNEANTSLHHVISTDDIGQEETITHQVDDLSVNYVQRTVTSGTPQYYDYDYGIAKIARTFNSSPNSFNLVVGDGSTAHINEDLSIISTGVLYINTNLPKGLQTNTTGNPASGAHNYVDICGAELSLTGGGSISIGSSSYSTAHVSVNNGSYIDMDYANGTSSHLIINDASKLTIESGGTLKVGEGASINLDGSNATLEIKGTLQLAENATFTFTGSGKVIFNSPVPDNIVFAPGSSIELIGSGISDVVAEVHQENLYLFRTGNDGTGSPRPDYDHIKISQGKVLMADNSRLCIDGDVELSHVVFDQLNSTDKPRGVYLYGQQNTTIEYCQFNHAKYGINCEDFLSYWLTNQLEINSSTFSNCDYGLFTRRKSTKLSNCTFNNCYYGWYAYGKPLPSVMHNGSITNCSEGIRIGGDFISLHLDGPDITNNSYGTRFYGRTLSAYCGDITDNYYGILAFGNELILSNNFKSKTGSVDLSDNTISITFDGEYLRLNNGNNDFSATDANTTGNLDITGHHPAWIGPVGAPSATAVFAANNIWAHTGLNEATYQDVSYGTVKVDGQDYFTLMYQEVPVEWNPAITTMGQCPSTYDSNNHGFNLVESGYHDLESGTPTLDFYELTGDNNHEFQGDDLQEAMETTIADLYDENVSNRFTLATNRLADILMVATNESSDAYVTYLLDYAYLRMMEAFGEACISEDALLPGGTLPQTVIDVQELIVDRMDDLYTNGETSAYYTRFNHSIDLAATYWLVDDLSSTITLLTDVTSWTTGSELDIANNLICRYNYENSVLTGVVPLENIIDTLYPCHDSLEIPYINSGGSGFVALSEQIAGAKPITLFPNPAQNIINYQFDASASERFTATVYNSKGQEVYTAGNIANKPGSQHQLDVSAFPAGMYLIKITSASRSQQARFTISR